MKLKPNFFKIGLLVIALVLTSCSPDDGVNGQDGQDGADGNANVTSVLFENQTINNGDNVFTILELTQDIYDNGIVYAYVTVTGNDYWEVLPISLSGNIILEIDRIRVGQVTLKADFNQGNIRLRFVLVEGQNISGVDFSDLNHVQDHFGF